MRSRPTFWILLCLLLAAGAWLFCRQAIHRLAEKSAGAHANSAAALVSSAAKSSLAGNVATNVLKSGASARTNHFAYRLSNTTKTIGALVKDPRAILLENALIDTRVKLNLSIPKNLQAKGDPGAYIVQANGPIDNSFRAMLAQSGAQIVSYIPNNAYLVTATAGAANAIAADGFSVIPYEPYYKVPSSLLAVISENVPQVMIELKVAAYPNTANQLAAELPQMGFEIAAEETSPFGEVFTVRNVSDVAALAQMPAVQRVEPVHRRVLGNDLSRPVLGVAADSVTTTNYMGLTGQNVMVEMNDSSVDATHPDLAGRVFGSPADLSDLNGHGTFVAGEIAGSGLESTTVTNAQGSINPGTNGQYRGKAPLAKLFIRNFNDLDQNLQEAAATNALISNNSWYYGGDSSYDLAAASYDAATRDALPMVTGSQSVLFVFAAGNDGNGDDTSDPGGGNADTIDSPATAKNVISVGAIQEMRDITNQVEESDGTTNAPWQAETSTGYRIAGFSSRGNVGIGTEGTFGRYKPDVVAPGTFVVSTRSSQWDIASYFFQSPTNFDVQEFDNIIVQPDSGFANSFPIVPNNAVQVTINIFGNADSPNPFPELPIFVGLESSPGYDFFTTNNAVSIPTDGGPGYLAAIQSSESFVGFNYAVSNITTEPISFDLTTDIITTNNIGNYSLVLSNLDQFIGTLGTGTGPGPYYRYESGTSMSAADISGVLALMQDYFTNTLQLTPSPALLKAMLINGARATGFYNFQVQNPINWEGWGLANLANSVPIGITNQFGMGCANFFLDQNPTNALATGDSHTFTVTVSTNASALPLRVTLAWTDPPGNPAAAIKLVNNLDLVVTNFDTTNVYFGNDIPASSVYNSAWSTNTPPNLDSINNIENVFLPPGAGAHFSITVIGRDVNVNAVTAQTNNVAGAYAPNVVQDYALVISCGEGEVTNAITVTDSGIVSNPTGDQNVTGVDIGGSTGIATNGMNGTFLNQLVGANTPLLGTNTISFGTNSPYASNAVVTVGMTNQWHFYVVTNTTSFTNAAFVTFLPETLSIPRMGVFADSDANSTRTEADIDLYVTTDPTLLNLNLNAVSNSVNGGQVGMSVGGVFNGASLERGGTEFVVDTNSSPNQVYYVGVKSEDQEASEFGFLPVFSQQPFSQGGGTNAEIINGVPLPVNIPDGSPAHPGSGYVFGLALQPIEAQDVIVSNTIFHQNFGDLIGTLQHNDVSVVLNNHDSLGGPPGPYPFTYDDGPAPVANSQAPDGPGSLQTYVGQQGIGPWTLTEVDDSLTQTGSVTNFNMVIQPHLPLDKGVTVSIGAGQWFYGFIDASAGDTNLTVYADDETPSGGNPLELFVNLGSPPTLADTNGVLLTNAVTIPLPGLGNSISLGPPLTPGRYFVGIFNNDSIPHTVYVLATLSFSASAILTLDFDSTGPVPILDDAVTTDTINVTNTDVIQDFKIGLRVDHPRISDLVFHLISPDGTRYLMMENRGGTSTNGCGVTPLNPNTFSPVTSSGGPEPQTNIVDTGVTGGTVQIDYDFLSQPDEMTIYYESNQIFDSHLINGSGTFFVNYGPGTSTLLTIIMNQNTNSQPTTAWSYTVHAAETNYLYLAFTENTNLTTTPIKFAPTPFVPTGSSNLYYLPEQDMSGIIDTSAFGTWQLEIQDDRAGATNNAVLDSWQLEFTFANTNLPPENLLPGPNCNPVPANGILWYQVNVPLNAIAATNTLLSSDQPVNLLFNQNTPDTNGAVVLLPTSTAGNFVLSTNVPPLVPGATYFLGVQNPNNVPVIDACVEVDFDVLATAYAFTEPATLVTGTNAQLNGMATPDGFPSIAWFQWGTNTLYGSNTPPVNVGAGLNVVYTTNQISSLVTNVPYHFRLVVSNALGVVNGFDQILDEANVIAWGADYAGQLNVPTNLNNVVAIAGAYDHNLALKTNGTVVAWGDNTFGQANVPSGLSNVVAMAGGQYFSMELQSNGTVTAWGASILAQTNVPAGLTNVVEIAGGTYCSLALKNDGTVTAWGAPFFNLTNVQVNATNIVAIAGGSYHNLALKNDGTVIVWGDDSSGQTNVPVGLTNVVAIAAGGFHSLALKNDGTVVAWGDDSADQTNVPAGLSNVVAVAAGGFHSMALKANGTVVMWGDNSSGQISLPTGLTNVVAISGGYLDSLALTPQFLINSTNVTVLPLSPGVPQTNNILAGDITYYQVNVPTNADFATNTLLFAQNGPLNIWFSTNTPPTLAVTNATLLLGGSTNGVSVLSTNGVPALVPGSTYYLGVQNTNSVTVNYAIEVTFHLVNLPTATNNIFISSIVYTNIGGTNGFLLTWFAPSNDLFQVQWTAALNPPVSWTTFTNPPAVGYNTNFPVGPTNAQFNFFDNGTQTGGFGPTRFYRLLLLQATNTLTLPSQTNFVVQALTTVTVTNTATDSNPGAVLIYSLVNSPTNASINTNGIITWTNATPAGLAARFNTVVTDNNAPPLTATNTFTIFVAPLPSITNVTVTATNVLLQWSAPTNDQFQVRWTTNLTPVITWTLFPNIITSANGLFMFTDTNAPLLMKFYQLVLLP